MREFVAIDLETTGLDPARDRVIEVGAVVFSADRVLERVERLVDPGRSVPPAILHLTGIEPADLQGAARQEDALRDLAGLMRGRQVVGHGATLDIDFLRAGGVWEPDGQVIDTLELARILLTGSPSHSLPLLAAELGLEQPRPHRALDDADATRQLLLRLRETATGLDEGLKEAMLALVAPYEWGTARFFAEALTAPSTAPDSRLDTVSASGSGGASVTPSDDPSDVLALLDPEGPFAAAFPDYELRESQQQMLLAVAQVMRRGGMLVVEAGTGTGKSLAYLLPALARALARGERVVVSTNTHTLQEQLMAKDLPAIRSWLPWHFEACLLKGRPNYISQRRWRRFLSEPCAAPDELSFKLKVLVWLHGTATGDRSELRLHGREEALWARVASDSLDCLGYHCTSQDCFVHRARAEAEAADLVVVNHALLMADAAQGGGVLPAFQHLIVDEAHHLEEAATQSLRCEVDGPGLLSLLERVGPAEGPVAALAARPRLGTDAEAAARAQQAAVRAREKSVLLFQRLYDWLRPRLTGTSRRDESIRVTEGTRASAGWEVVVESGRDAVTSVAALGSDLSGLVDSLRDWLAGEEPDPDLRELETIRLRLAEASDLLRAVLLEPDANRVCWLTLQARTDAVALRSAPVEVGDLLREHVYAGRDTVIFTSASLAVGGTFDYFRSRVGLSREPDSLVLASPFDYLRQALVCLPRDLPELGTPEFEDLLPEVIGDLASAAGGRTLALFTSHSQLRETYERLKQRHDLDDLLILGQGIDGQRRQVLRSFVEGRRPLLLGTSSFWEGIDVAGDRLSCVIVVRLPFPVPTEPVYAARAERVRDPFLQLALPQAALRLKQGFGRLIRRSTDSGAVVILDPRISTREYGRAFLEVLPPAARFTGPVAEVAPAVRAWLER